MDGAGGDNEAMNDAQKYQTLKAKLLALHLDPTLETDLLDRTRHLVKDGHSHTGALLRAMMEKRVKV